ncbi:MAG: putative zinc-binding peptidase [Acidimicrobiia bacterium]|nr:putative zinc-binding peptidase [Acidimicrobiia bacterium]
MRPVRCSECGQLVFFENSACLRCGALLGFVPDRQDLVTLRSTGDRLEVADGSGGVYRYCRNQQLARCNWMVAADEPHDLCVSCRLTSVRPNDNEPEAMAAFADAEEAKRRLIAQLLALGLPLIDRAVDGERGVTFELLSSWGGDVTTGHHAGVITLDLSESDDAHREFVRQQLGEPYRTVLGHLRHEIGHYFWPLLVVDTGQLDDFRRLFGDDRLPYDEALRHHYASSGAASWADTHVSQYATVHPWEDWAETFAHYLHIRDGLETAAAFGLTAADPARSVGGESWPAPGEPAIGPMVRDWLALTLALNAMSRSIGQGDLYPFVLSPAVVDKLDYVHGRISAAARQPR